MTREQASELIAYLSEADPAIGRDSAERFVQTAPEAYFTVFDRLAIVQHAGAYFRLQKHHPHEILARRHDDGLVDVTLVTFDYPSEFSLLTGVLGASGFDIRSGSAFTFRATADTGRQLESAGGRSDRRRKPGQSRYFSAFGPRPSEVMPERKIIDTFSGVVTDRRTFDAWEDDTLGRLRYFMDLLTAGTDASQEQAKREVHEEVARSLQHLHLETERILYPVQIELDETDEGLTRMSVVSEDTPFFLYALSNALSLQDVSIQQVTIRTAGTRIEDEIGFVDRSGNAVTDPGTLDRIRLSVLLTKQFTYFLGQAPDPYSALVRFENLATELPASQDSARLAQMLANPRFLQDLARLLGASDFLWEDFLHLQYESILPLIGRSGIGGVESAAGANGTLSSTRSRLPALLASRFADERSRLGRTLTAAERRRVLNDFKDKESYLVDVDHILNSDLDFFFLSRRLSAIAELVINTAVEIAWDEITPGAGVPRTAAGFPAGYAIFGLGKLGGAALGYASDLEVLFVYSDNGRTDGNQPLSNAEFFERLFRDAVAGIESKREGIYQVDLRLRPHGSAGPYACSLENFVRYYGPGGDAHSYELLSLVRLRTIGGDPDLGAQVERIRDQFIYSGGRIDLKAIRELRGLQLREKAEPGRLNAKFSPGALVDLEYSVQILQVVHGKTDVSVRTPRIHKALEALAAAGTIPTDEGERIAQAYRFLRTLINGLRMLRGNARDLFLPDKHSPEYAHLARRMGYQGQGELSPEEELHVEFETRTAAIRTFVETHLGRDALPGPRTGTVADLVLADSLEESVVDEILTGGGFRKPRRSYVNLRSLAAAAGAARDRFAELAVLAWDYLRSTPDPDMALNNWDRFAQTLQTPVSHFTSLLSQPKRLQILFQIFAGSQFLADTLTSNPDFFEWVTTPEIVATGRTLESIRFDLSHFQNESYERSHADSEEPHRAELNRLRRFRRREILRIGTRDLCLGVPLPTIVEELSMLAKAITEACLAEIWLARSEQDRTRSSAFCVLAFGKLGGRELNYSSDIDLIGIYERSGETENADDYRLFAAVMEALRHDLSVHTDEGYAYRVDLRLRPYGASGALVSSLPTIRKYYRDSASLWEIQALLKLSPLAGNIALGDEFLESVKPQFVSAWHGGALARTVREMRATSIDKAERSLSGGAGQDIKSGRGGIRDIEFTVQLLQIAHCEQDRGLLTGNTLAGLTALREAGIVDGEFAVRLERDYIFLRRIEHFLQLFEDRQVHAIPTDPDARRALALRCTEVEERSPGLPRVRTDSHLFSAMGKDLLAAPRTDDEIARITETFFARVEETTTRVHEIFREETMKLLKTEG